MFIGRSHCLRNATIMAYSINPHVSRTLEPPTGETSAWRASGDLNPQLPLIDASQAVPSYPPADELIDHLAQQVRIPETAFYTDILGIPELRDALAGDLSKTYGVAVTSADIAITSGGNHAYCMAMLALAGPGDDVILVEPYYFNHQMWFDMQGIGTRLLTCRETAEGVLPDIDEARNLVGDRTRAIVLVSPNNPTGTIYSPDFLAAFHELARQNDLALVVDETYKDFLPDGTTPHHLFQDPHWRESFVFLYSFSKVYSLTGYRVGALAGGSQFIEAISKIADTMTICAPNIGQKAALFGLRNLSAWAAEKRDGLAERLDILRAAFDREQPDFKLVSSGAFFGYLSHPFDGQASLDVSHRLYREASLLTWPGSFFGPGQDRYIRLAFANSSSRDIEKLSVASLLLPRDRGNPSIGKKLWRAVPAMPYMITIAYENFGGHS